MGVRRRFTPSEKAKVALAALREEKSSAEIARAHKVHNSQVTKWKEQAIVGLSRVFERSGARDEQAELEAGLYEEIGRLQTELRWLKKKYQDWSDR